MWAVWSTRVEMHFVSSLIGMGWVWSTHVGMHFVSSLAWEVLGQHKLRCILCVFWHGMGLGNTSWDEYCVLAGLGWDRSTQVEMNFAWSTHVEMHLVFSLVLDGFGPHIFWCFLYPRWNGREFVNLWWDAFWVLVGMEWVLSTHVELHFVSSLKWEGFVEHMLR